LFYALLMLTSTTAVAAFDAVGAVLFIAFVIVPPSAAYLLSDRLAHMIAIGIAISIASSVLGYHAAVALDVSIGGMMAVMTGGFLAAAFLFGPRYGALAQAWRRRGQRSANDSRVLAVHLFHHEASPACDDENVVRALRDHLRWSERKAERVVARSLRQGVVLRDGARLYLTARGRQLALELLEPWRVAA
jgi:manganese/zinc/iron transport system permease protein